MPRVRTVPADELTGTAREIYERSAEYGPFAGLAGVMANRAPVLEHTFELLLDCLEHVIGVGLDVAVEMCALP